MTFNCPVVIIGLILCIGGIPAAAAEEALKGNPDKALPIVEQLCAGCHGIDGNSPVPNFPKLAGQHVEYLFHEMQEYKSRKRDNEMMSPLLQDISEQDMANLAAYFTKQTPVLGTVNNPELLGFGKKIYLEGNPQSGVPSCEGCHEENGHGSPRYPRVAGQNAEYSVEQFRLYAHGGRKFGKKIMRAVAGRLTAAEIKAVSEYMASMP